MTNTATPQPIMIDCEGAGYPSPHGICTMCGVPTSTTPVPPHQRKDVLAMIDRGDFDPS